jgi:hypothetical protein
MSPTITANWQASSGNVWTVPVGGGVARVFRLGYQPLNASVAFFGNAVHPAGGSPWGMRLQISFLFPKRPGAAGKGQKGDDARFVCRRIWVLPVSNLKMVT